MQSDTLMEGNTLIETLEMTLVKGKTLPTEGKGASIMP